MTRITIITDAWRPQVNGVVRTLERLQFEAFKQGVQISFVTPAEFKTLPMPGYPEIRLAIASQSELVRKINSQNPDAIHIATEGPLGILARRYALRAGRRFTTCYHTAFPQYLSARFPIPEGLTYSYLRRFHNASATTMVATEQLRSELSAHGFKHLAIWSRGVDAELFKPRTNKLVFGEWPQLLYVGRVSIEKNIDAFLKTPMMGTKIIVGDGPDRTRLQLEYPDAIFLGVKTGQELAEIYASANVFVFPSKTDTFGLVLLEALASGLPVAAFPAGGFLNSIESGKVGVLNQDLSESVWGALKIAPTSARNFALGYTHENSTKQFIENVVTALDIQKRSVT